MSLLQQHYAEPVLRTTERRASPRIRTVYLVVKVRRAHDVGLFRARNISDAGMMMCAHVAIDVGERVAIELSDSFVVQATVEWCRDGCCGVQFDEEIDSAGFLKSLAEEKRDCQRRSQRLSVKRLATSYSECGIRAVTIIDVSARGVGLTHNGSLHAGVLVKLVLESGLTRAGAVCWSKEGHAGVLLAEPFSHEELESASAL
jgi:hypothetical protein